ncbi:MAG: DNA repair protein RecN [Gammaproteobacteria bacterium]|nr:MAG: DNA repair protein RecN [Gammaproteobacteria bacterium]
MLTHLTVTNFAIAKQIDLSFQAGMTVITGETGAGKSIILDALGLALGDRADAGVVRHGESRADISASFDLARLTETKSWLAAHDLSDEQQCILRRVITKEGRSRGYINGQPVPMQQLRLVGEKLIDIHSQHEHQSLLRKENHLKLLDSFAHAEPLAKSVNIAYKTWSESAEKLAELQSSSDEKEARMQLVRYQLQELDQLDLQPGEIEALEKEQALQANVGQLIQSSQQVAHICSESDEAITSQLAYTLTILTNANANSDSVNEAIAMLTEAQIQVEEASASLRRFSDNLEVDPTRLAEIEDRLSTVYQLSRKHKVLPEQLVDVQARLRGQIKEYENGDANIATLSQQTQKYSDQYRTLAEQLSQKRRQQAARLDQAITRQLKALHMPSVTFQTRLESTNSFTANGLESIEFTVSMNPGQPPKALAKVASGGELSRISLAIQVIIVNSATIPTLVFDEVDVGIGGATAEVVGRLLRQLGDQGQIVCVTHLPQVAAIGSHHLKVSKSIDGGETTSSLDYLNEQARTEEVARMLGGIEITEKSLAHAREMLETAD